MSPNEIYLLTQLQFLWLHLPLVDLSPFTDHPTEYDINNHKYNLKKIGKTRMIYNKGI